MFVLIQLLSKVAYINPDKTNYIQCLKADTGPTLKFLNPRHLIVFISLIIQQTVIHLNPIPFECLIRLMWKIQEAIQVEANRVECRVASY